MTFFKKGMFFVIVIFVVSIVPALTLILFGNLIPTDISPNYLRDYGWGPVVEARDYQSESSFPLLWKKDNIFIAGNNFGSQICVNKDMIFMIGSLNNVDYPSMHTIDIDNGEVAWRTQHSSSSNITCDDDSVYVGVDNSILALDSRTGSQFWQTQLFAKKNILYIDSDERYVYAHTVPDDFYVLDKRDGNIVYSISPSLGDVIFRIDGNKVYSRPSPNLLQAKDRLSDHILWQSNVPVGFTQVPMFENDTIYLQNDVGSIYAIDSNSGQLVLEESSSSKEGSYLAYHVNGQSLYVLTDQSEVIIKPLFVGGNSSSLQFSIPESKIEKTIVRPFYIAIYDKFLVIYFGDNRELFVIDQIP